MVTKIRVKFLNTRESMHLKLITKRFDDLTIEEFELMFITFNYEALHDSIRHMSKRNIDLEKSLLKDGIHNGIRTSGTTANII